MIASIVTGGGRFCFAKTLAASAAVEIATLILNAANLVGSCVARLNVGTMETRLERGDADLRVHGCDQLHEERSVPEVRVTHLHRVHLGVVDAHDLVAPDEDVVARMPRKEFR